MYSAPFQGIFVLKSMLSEPSKKLVVILESNTYTYDNNNNNKNNKSIPKLAACIQETNATQGAAWNMSKPHSLTHL